MIGSGLLPAFRGGLALVVPAFFLLAPPAASEISLSLSAGTVSTFDTGVGLTGPGDTDLEFDPVSWSSESFRSPIYYGVRVLYWPGAGWESGWGFGLDFVHIKMFAALDETVGVQGTRDGSPVADRERLGDTFLTLSFSHGHNLLLATAVYRWGREQDPSSFLQRLHPYAGVGAGVAIPHVEITLEGGGSTDEYQLSGPALQGLAGIEARVTGSLAVFVEGRLAYASLDTDLNGGGNFAVRPWTAQLAFGLSIGLPFPS